MLHTKYQSPRRSGFREQIVDDTQLITRDGQPTLADGRRSPRAYGVLKNPRPGFEHNPLVARPTIHSLRDSSGHLVQRSGIILAILVEKVTQGHFCEIYFEIGPSTKNEMSLKLFEFQQAIYLY